MASPVLGQGGERRRNKRQDYHDQRVRRQSNENDYQTRRSEGPMKDKPTRYTDRKKKQSDRKDRVSLIFFICQLNSYLKHYTLKTQFFSIVFKIRILWIIFSSIRFEMKLRKSQIFQ